MYWKKTIRVLVLFIGGKEILPWVPMACYMQATMIFVYMRLMPPARCAGFSPQVFIFGRRPHSTRDWCILPRLICVCTRYVKIPAAWFGNGAWQILLRPVLPLMPWARCTLPPLTEVLWR